MALKKQGLKRKRITLETKIQILDRLKTGEGSSSVAKHFELNEATVRTIKKNEEKIRASVAAGCSESLKRTSHVRDTTLELMEKALIHWVEENIQKKIPIEGDAIRQKAVEIFNNIKAKQPATSNQATEFSGSKGWLERFKKRFSLCNAKIRGEVAITDEKAATEYPKEFSKIIQDGAYTPDQVFNANEMGLFWKKMPRRTYLSQSERSNAGFKASKERITVLLCSNASGDYLMKPMVISRSLNPRAMKSLDKGNLPVYWKADNKTCVTVPIFRDWFYNCFVSDVELYVKEKNLSFKVLLLIDSAPRHPTDLHHDNVKVVFLPPNTASLIQPLERSIFTTFNAYYIKHIFKRIVDEVNSGNTLSVTRVWENYSIVDCVELIKLAITEIKKSTLNACWKSIWPDVVVSGHDVPALENEYSEIMRLAHRVGGEGFDDMASNELEELMTDSEFNAAKQVEVVFDSTSSEDETDCDEKVPRLTLCTIDKGLAMAKELENFFIQNDPNMDRSLKFARELHNCMASYKKLSEDSR
ncbi:Tigger transposable element-derived protein 1 [Araneus ventricosus]|uniref:Tigger transposable element-derived protein 1 n=1 Tax=Araneus ventricosus TaxID=182803 RepID=A0A4Y2B316_ARAVE|nr:Tigger transposable element-derived protein 1 [Araneus ventricosus]